MPLWIIWKGGVHICKQSVKSKYIVIFSFTAFNRILYRLFLQLFSLSLNPNLPKSRLSTYKWPTITSISILICKVGRSKLWAVAWRIEQFDRWRTHIKRFHVQSDQVIDCHRHLEENLIVSCCPFKRKLSWPIPLTVESWREITFNFTSQPLGSDISFVSRSQRASL